MPMTNPRKDAVSSRLAQGMGYGLHAQVLNSVRDSEIDLAIWQRPLSPCLKYWLQTINPRDLLDRRFNVSCHHLAKDIETGLSDLSPAFVADVRDLARKYAEISRCEQISVRLECVTDNACRKFHTDYVGLRLITSYVGPGTEWAYQDSLGSETKPYQLAPGEVGLFKGRKWRTDYMPQIWHRSPPIAGKGVARLLLVIDDLLLETDDVGQ